MKAADTARGLTVRKLITLGLKCDSFFDSANPRKKRVRKFRKQLILARPKIYRRIAYFANIYYIPFSITCSAPQIEVNGNVGNVIKSVTTSKDIEMKKSSQASMLNAVRELEDKTRKMVVDLIVSRVPQTYSSLINIPSFP